MSPCEGLYAGTEGSIVFINEQFSKYRKVTCSD